MSDTIKNESISPRGVICPGPMHVTINKNQVATDKVVSIITPPQTILIYSLESTPLNGTATINPNTGQWVYTPSTDFVGHDSFAVYSTVSGPGVSTTRCSTDIYIDVVDVQLTVTKSASKAYVKTTDTLTYTVEVTNTGSITIDSAVVTDILPANTTIAPNSTYINGVLTPGANISSGITITSLAVAATKTITFTVNVSGATSGEILSNVVNYTAKSTVSGSVINKEGSSNTVKTPVLVATLDKIVDKASVLQGDTLDYKITFTNSTGFALSSAIIKDTIPAMTTLVPNSTKVNGVLDPLANIISGIQVGPLAVGKTATVEFKVRVDNAATAGATISNIASLTFIASAGGFDITDTISSKPTSSTVLAALAILNMVKSASPSQVNVGDTVKYTLTIKNTGSLDATSVILTDLLAPELSYANDLTVNGASKPGDITKGVDIGTVSAGGTTIVTFNVTVSTLPPNINISNTTTGVFAYTLPSGTVVKGNVKSNTVTIQVFEVDATMTKVSDKSMVNVADTFTYTITVENTGNIDTTDYILTDALPSQFQVQQITVNGVVVSGDLGLGISLGIIKAGQTVIIKVKILVISEFSNNIPYNNMALGNLEYSINGVPGSKEIIATDTIGVVVVQATLILEKSSNVDMAIVGDVINYTITATNNGDVDFTDVVIKDLLAPGIDFVEGSVVVDTVSMPSENILSGVDVGSISVNGSVILMFKAIVVNEVETICNVASADYYYSINGGVTTLYGMKQSNPNCIIIEKSTVLVTKEANKTLVSLNDIIEYTATITNNGTSAINSVVFRDILPNTLMLINNSVTINGVQVINPNLSLGINIGIIAPKVTVTIKYEAKVIAGTCSGKIENNAYAEYKYVLSNGSVKTRISNIAAVEICSNISSFKQLSIDKLCEIPCQKPDMEEVNDVFVDGKILSYYVIKTHQGISNEGQNLSGYKLVVNGTLSVVIEYTANVKSQSIHSYSCEIPFGTFIILPANYVKGNAIDVNIKIEDIDYEALNCRETFVNIMYLVIAKVH
ncbi:MAG: DUF3794 domain-containing protein [Clostridium sp.]